MTHLALASVASIYRYPVKGLSPEPLPTVGLEVGQTLPGDRAFAIENGPIGFDPANPRYFPKIRFLMLMRNERLAALRSRYDAATGEPFARCDLGRMSMARTATAATIRVACRRRAWGRAVGFACGPVGGWAPWCSLCHCQSAVRARCSWSRGSPVEVAVGVGGESGGAGERERVQGVITQYPTGIGHGIQ